jgi:group II intron reverse transcriptase/maturase
MNNGKTYYVVDIDIKGFFDNVDHAKLLKQLWTLGVKDKRLLSILSKMLKAEIEGIGKPDKGTPQGGILSPLLANVVLNELDWWIDSQWQSFQAPELKKIYNQKGVLNRGNVYLKLRRDTDLKEMYIIRYADDFKIMCRNKEDAEKAYIGIQLWLKDRLGLEVSEDKSKIVDVRKGSSEFLGLRFKVKRKGNKWVVNSHLTEKSKDKVVTKLKKGLEQIQHSPAVASVYKYNSVVLGIQNYYRIATHVNDDFSAIDYKMRKFRISKIKGIMSESGRTSKAYKTFYKGYNYKKQFVAGLCLYPVPALRHVYPISFTQEICGYTAEGRKLIHENLHAVNMRILHYLMENPPRNGSLELADNRLSLYSAQLGRCYVTKEILEIGEMECHHKKPREHDGTDVYSNLVWVTSNVHELIHATRPETIAKYLQLVKPHIDAMDKLNKLRITAGNCVIA